jgi:hypothetical protein
METRGGSACLIGPRSPSIRAVQDPAARANGEAASRYRECKAFYRLIVE